MRKALALITIGAAALAASPAGAAVTRPVPRQTIVQIVAPRRVCTHTATTFHCATTGGSLYVQVLGGARRGCVSPSMNSTGFTCTHVRVSWHINLLHVSIADGPSTWGERYTTMLGMPHSCAPEGTVNGRTTYSCLP